MTTQREALLTKIRALLSKTIENGATEAEALAALAKARAMVDAYDVGDDELELTKEEAAIILREPRDSTDPHKIKQHLAVAVGKFCECTAWRNHSGTISFCGLRPDAQLATWMLDTLTAFVTNELVNHLVGCIAEGRERRRVLLSFALGCCDRISQRLDQLREQSASLATPNAKALVVVKDAAVKATLDALGISLCSRRSSATIGNSASYGAGKAAGDRASFGRPVSGQNATLRLK